MSSPSARSSLEQLASASRLRAHYDSHRTLRHLWMSVAMLIAVFFGGVAGFLILGDDRTIFEAMWMTAHVITTVGDSRNELNGNERIWELILMLAGISAALYAAGTVVAFFVDGELRRVMGKRQLQKSIASLKNHFIVCGFGRMGRVLCEQLGKQGVPFIVIERDESYIAEADELGYLYIAGDAMSEQHLEAARIEHARGLATVLGDDASNVFVTLSARGMNPKLHIIARGENTDTEPKLRRAGADKVICPPVIGAKRITQMLLQPAIDELLELTGSGPDLEISKVSMANLPKAVGPTLRELAIPAETGLMVIAVIHANGDRQLNPPANFTLLASDELLIIGPNGGADRMLEMFGEKDREA